MKEVEGYASASEVVRNLRQISAPYELMFESAVWRILRFEPPYVLGNEYWVVNDKGFLWEPADSLEAATAYLSSAEALDYEREVSGSSTSDKD